MNLRPGVCKLLLIYLKDSSFKTFPPNAARFPSLVNFPDLCYKLQRSSAKRKDAHPMGYFNNEALFKKFFVASDWADIAGSALAAFAGFIFALSTLLFCSLILFDFGFRKTATANLAIHQTYLLLLSSLFVSKLLIEALAFRTAKWFAVLFRVLVLAAVFLILLVNLQAIPDAWSGITGALGGRKALILGALGLMATQIHHLSGALNRINVSPSLLFAGSFLSMILFGSGLLMMPNATFHSISYLEALFTATSAVCVTGLTVVDTATAFTPTGKVILMLLIQIGGLGIMTFAAFFSYIFLGSASVKDRLLLKDFFSSENLGGLYKILLKILLFTVMLEAAGAALIYNVLDGHWFYKLQDSIFNAISAFCNAGFSVYPQGLCTDSIRLNYPLQLIICALIILGGIGFPLLLTLYNILKQRTRSLWFSLIGGKNVHHAVRWPIGERLAFQTTIVLIISGTVAYYWFEAFGVQDGNSALYRSMTAFFASVSARTAGFNVVDLTTWSYPTIFLIMFLMWVGASPGSTGGGIKTATLAVAVKTVIGFLQGKNTLEIGDREIGTPTIVRVLTIISLSLVFIFTGSLLLMIFDPTKQPLHLLFECVSAFSTTGLSVVKTESLSNYSKVVLMILMFVGRIGPVVLLSGLLLTKNSNLYRLPVEDIKIN